MTVKEVVEWCEKNDIPLTTNVCFDRGIDLIEEASRCVFNGMDLVLIGKEYDDDEAVL